MNGTHPGDDWSRKADEVRVVMDMILEALYPQPDTSSAPYYNREIMLEALVRLGGIRAHMESYAISYQQYEGEKT